MRTHSPAKSLDRAHTATKREAAWAVIARNAGNEPTGSQMHGGDRHAALVVSPYRTRIVIWDVGFQGGNGSQKIRRLQQLGSGNRPFAQMVDAVYCARVGYIARQVPEGL
jgi:hypothetical protein